MILTILCVFLFQRLNSHLSTERSERLKSEEKLQEVMEDQRSTENSLQISESEAKIAREELDNMNGEINDLRESLQNALKESHNAKTQNEKLDSYLNEVRRNYIDSQKELSEAQSNASKFEAENVRLQAALARIEGQANVSASKMETMVESGQSRIQQLENELNESVLALQQQQQQCSSLDQTVGSLTQTIKTYETTVMNLREELSQTQQHAELQKNRADDYERTVQQLDEDLGDVTSSATTRHFLTHHSSNNGTSKNVTFSSPQSSSHTRSSTKRSQMDIIKTEVQQLAKKIEVTTRFSDIQEHLSSLISKLNNLEERTLPPGTPRPRVPSIRKRDDGTLEQDDLTILLQSILTRLSHLESSITETSLLDISSQQQQKQQHHRQQHEQHRYTHHSHSINPSPSHYSGTPNGSDNNNNNVDAQYDYDSEDTRRRRTTRHSSTSRRASSRSRGRNLQQRTTTTTTTRRSPVATRHKSSRGRSSSHERRHSQQQQQEQQQRQYSTTHEQSHYVPIDSRYQQQQRHRVTASRSPERSDRRISHQYIPQYSSTQNHNTTSNTSNLNMTEFRISALDDSSLPQWSNRHRVNSSSQDFGQALDSPSKIRVTSRMVSDRYH
eukprot:TRINITY_DN329_c0_g4_i3.p1 TRINITY_DN329_c0_g4~~TRINITY_DN329_c0_g4_i3.p1  ORF type:complete len:614 (-),score=239.93 TRINITY_DN329_c0_g4_i3:364-2205(-)